MILSLRIVVILVFIFIICGAWAIIKAVESLVIEVLGIEAPQDVLEVKSAMVGVDEHHSCQVIIGIEVFERILQQVEILDKEHSDGLLTYLSDPLEGLCAQLDSVETEEADCALRRNSDHEELVIQGNLNIANVITLVIVAILTVVDFSHISVFIVDIDCQFFASHDHQEGVVFLNIDQGLELGDRNVCFGSLDGWFVKLSITGTISKDLACATSKKEHRCIFGEGCTRDIISLFEGFHRELHHEPARV